MYAQAPLEPGHRIFDDRNLLTLAVAWHFTSANSLHGGLRYCFGLTALELLMHSAAVISGRYLSFCHVYSHQVQSWWHLLQAQSESLPSMVLQRNLCVKERVQEAPTKTCLLRQVELTQLMQRLSHVFLLLFCSIFIYTFYSINFFFKLSSMVAVKKIK